MIAVRAAFAVGAIVLAACAAPPRTVSMSVFGPTTGIAARDNERPALFPGADTNAAEAYLQLARGILNRAPDTAAAAFAWAIRLDPMAPEGYHGRATALLLAYADPNPGVPAYILRTPIPPDRLHYIDSLMTVALLRDPFLPATFDYLVTGGGPYPGYEQLKRRDPALAGYIAYESSRFEEASALLAKAIGQSPKNPVLRSLRAQAEAFWARWDPAARSRYDTAAAELERLVAVLDERDSLRTSLAYDSRAIVYYALGAVHIQRRDTLAARHAYERALAENLSLYVAHARLAGLAFARLDTAAALAELAAGDEAGAYDPVYQYYHGMALHAARRVREAEEHLLRTVSLAPYWAMPYFVLGRLYEDSGNSDRAVQAYRDHVARAERRALTLTHARARIDALSSRHTPAAVTQPH